MQVAAFAKVVGSKDGNLGGLASAAGCFFSPPPPSKRGRTGFDVELASPSVLGLTMGLNLLFDALEGNDNLERIQFAMQDWAELTAVEVTNLQKQYLGLHAQTQTAGTAGVPGIFQATFFVRRERVALIEKLKEPDVLKKIQAKTCCIIEVPGKDPNGFNITVKSWNPVFLGLGLRAITTIFDHNETDAVHACKPEPMGHPSYLKNGTYTVSGSQKDSYKKLRTEGSHEWVFQKIKFETCSEMVLPAKGAGYVLEFKALTWFQVAFARAIAIDILTKKSANTCTIM
ncbi:hypothetical protein WJX73_001459 [Symbiochloris irregularis]|uniref:Uncharacterized protein n=1 Tax=Symbiochloris irregularis TaxID=706552 RepID=A0AAW1NZT6_9CHLO